jgi:hemolysin activation/secretion protein
MRHLNSAKARRILQCLAASFACTAPPLLAQQGTLDRPNTRPLELPQYTAPQPGRVLPDIVVPQQPSLTSLAAGRELPVTSIEVRGATVLTKEEIAALVGPYLGRSIRYTELETLRLALTRAYVERGYVTSGARIPDQDVAGGVVRVDVVEGRLAEVTVKTDGRLRPGPIQTRLTREAGGIVNVARIEQTLQVLQQEPTIRKVDAVLLPGARPGDSRLEVSLQEAAAPNVQLGYANEENPAIGAEAARVRVRWLNLLGYADEIGASYAESDGYEQLEATYALPLGSRGTRLELRYVDSTSEVIEQAFRQFDIESESRTYAVTLHQPVLRTLGSSIELFAGYEDRRSLTSLLGEGFSFTPGPHAGETQLSVVRTGLDATWRGARQVFAARVQGSFGLDANDATRNEDLHGVPDAKFTSVLAQMQWAARLPWLGTQFQARLDHQYAADPLFGLEQFALGGASTVRGYVASALVRDNGTVASAELRVPILAGTGFVPRVELAPFVDWGEAWNTDGRSRGGRETLSGAGLGLRLAWRWLAADVYWADALQDLGSGAAAEALREDWHFSIRARWPQ